MPVPACFRRAGRVPILAALTVALLLGILPGGAVAAHDDATPGTGPMPASSLGWSDAFDDDEQLNVATTVAPISSIVRNVGGTRIDLHGVVPDGTNSHTFEPAPSDAALLAAADLVIVNGLALEDPTIELAEANLRPGAEIYSLGEQTIAREEWAFDFSFPEAAGDPNPHLWVNVPYAMKYAELVYLALAERDPVNAGYYAHNLERYLAVLARLDAGIAAAVQTVPEANRRLLTYHDSYAYFARHYGMIVIGAAQPSDFSEPSPREVAGLIDQIRETGVPAVFGSEVFPSDVLEQIAAEAGAAYVDGLRDDDPPGDPGHTYVGMMLANMELMIPALGGTVEALAGLQPWDSYEDA